MVYGLLLPLLWTGFEKETLRPLKLYFALTPLIAVVCVCYSISGEDGVRQLFQKFSLKGFAHRWFFLSTWSFSIIGITALIVRYLYDGFFPPFEDFGPIDQMLLYSLPLFLFPGITEEFAWRGFLQSQLQQKYQAVYACVIVGLVWGSWHYPDFLLGNWDASIGSQLGFFAFTISASIFIGWLFIQTNENVFIAMLAHFGANIVFTFSPIFYVYEDRGYTSIFLYIGLVWLVVLVIIGFFGLDLKHKKLSEKTELSRL
jgi:CAAX protease family protein